MIRDELYKSFIDYLSPKNVFIAEDSEKMASNTFDVVNEKLVKEQLFNLSEFHKRAMGYKGVTDERLDNKTGSLVEQYKINIRRLKRYIKNIRMNTATSDFERILLKKGNDYIQRAEACITEIYASGYMDILERSMKRNEICLGNIDLTNIKGGEKLYVVSLEKCCYNNVEMDCFFLLSKLKRRGLKLDWQELVNTFCEYEGLTPNSRRLIIALMSYPHSFIKCCNRYREKTKEWSEEEYEPSLDRAINKDGDSLLGG